MIGTPTEREDEGPWAKLRRRKMVQWGVAYVAGAWAALQGVAYLRDTFGWPYQIQRLATLLLIVALPVVLCLPGSTATAVSSASHVPRWCYSQCCSFSAAHRSGGWAAWSSPLMAEVQPRDRQPHRSPSRR